MGAFLRDGWNVFDLVVVALSLVPGVGAFATVARIARVLRVARLVSLSPKLRLIVGTMMRSIPSLTHVSLLLGLLLYMYAVIGVNLFGAHDPEHWGWPRPGAADAVPDVDPGGLGGDPGRQPARCPAGPGCITAASSSSRCSWW